MAGVYKYIPQDWQKFNNKLNMETNIELGGVATPERMEHIEEGLIHANAPLSIEIIPGVSASTTITEKDGRKYITVVTDALEEKWKPMNIILDPSDEENTEVTETKATKNIIIRSTKVEPRWPSKLEVVLIPGDKDNVKIEDDEDNDVRKLLITSRFLNTVAIKPLSREIVIDIDDWVEGVDNPYEAYLNVEAEIDSCTFVRFTKGSNITREQLNEIDTCEIRVVENLNGTFKAVAKTRPSIDIPLHAAVL